MHDLFTKVLSRRDLSRAGDLFSVADAEIVDDLAQVLAEIDSIISQPDYQQNTNDQSVVEICVTRVLSCIRETKSAERHCVALVALLNTCLQHNLKPPSAHKVDPPHAKISADIISSIFLNYNKKPVMLIALPVAVKFLQKGNAEMSRNLASYLSLAAIEYASLLSPHVQPILDSICTDANYGLCRLLPQIYEVSPEQLNGSVAPLVLLLPRCDVAERLALLQLFALMARQRPAVLEAYVPQLCEQLANGQMAQATMQVLLPLAEHVATAAPIAEQFSRLRAAALESPSTVTLTAQIMAAAGKVNKDKAQLALDFVLEHLPHADRTAQSIFLHEATMLCSTYPILFNEKVLACVRQRNQQTQSPASVSAVLQPTIIAAGAGASAGAVVSSSSTTATVAAKPSPVVAAPKHLAAAHAKEVNKTSGGITIVKLNAAPVPVTEHHRSHHTTPNVGRSKLANGQRGSASTSSASTSSEPPAASTKLAETAAAAPHVVTIHTTSSVVTSTPPPPSATQTSTTSSQNGSNSTASSTTTTTTTTTTGGYTRRAKLGDSRSTGRLHSASNTHRSMTRLNIAGGSVGGLHKSMTRLSSSQLLQQQQQQQHQQQQQQHQQHAAAAHNPHSSSGNSLLAAAHSATFHSTAPAPVQHINHHHHHPPNYSTQSHQNHNHAPQSPPQSPPILSHLHDSNYVTPVPPLSSNVIITGHNRWGIPSTKITSGGVTVTTATSLQPMQPMSARPRPHSQGPSTLGMGSTGALGSSSVGGVGGIGAKLSGSALNQSTGSIGMMQQQQQPQQQHLSPPNSPPIQHQHSHQQQQQQPSAGAIQTHHISVHHASPAGVAAAAAAVGSTSPTSPHPNHQHQHHHHHHNLQQQQHTHLPPQSPKSVMTLPVNATFASTSSAQPSSEVIVCGPLTVTSRRNNDNTSVTLLNSSSVVGGTGASGGTGTGNSISNQRMSTFEPYQIMRDTVQQFCEKHFASIKEYMDKLSHRLPPPTRCGIEERRTKKVAKLHFACQIRGPHCLYSKTCFTMRTRNPKTWIHLMFLDFQIRNYVKDNCALSTREPGISNLKNMWNMIRTENKSFTELVTSNFPSIKEQEALVNELRHSGFLDVFEVSRTDRNTPNANELEFQWGCFLCNHPEKAVGFLHGTNQPMIEGQLKEKKGKWRLFRRWRTRYFTLSGAHLSCKGSSGGESIDVNQIRSVKVSRGARNIPKAFEIFTGDQTLILKPKDGKNAEEWVQCLSIVVAHSQARDNPMAKTNSLPARGLGNSRTAF